MAELPDYFPKGADPAAVRAEWVAACEALVSEVEGWCRGTDWATRRLDKRVEDPPLDPYDAPMLLMQYWDLRVLLEPSSRFGYQDDGQFDLYVMPAYDDLAVLVRKGGRWHLRMDREGERYSTLLTRDTFWEATERFVRLHSAVVQRDRIPDRAGTTSKDPGSSARSVSPGSGSS